MTTEEAQRKEQNANLAVQIAREELERQLAFVDAVDSKLSTVIGFASASLVIFGGILAVEAQDVPDASVALVIAGAGAYVALMLASLFAFIVRDWHMGPRLDELEHHKTSHSQLELLDWAHNQYVFCFRENDAGLRHKARLCRIALWALFVQSGLLMASVVTALFA